MNLLHDAPHSLPRRCFKTACLLSFALVAACFAAAARTTPSVKADSGMQHVGVIAYFQPGTSWQQLIASAPNVSDIVINPDNGPGATFDGSYTDAIAAAQAQGIRVLGYVHTSYTARPLTGVLAEVDRYYAWYHVDGIFVDEVPTVCRLLPYYLQLFDYVKAQQGADVVVLDPGKATTESECYLSAADSLVTFEGNYPTYLMDFAAPSWIARYSADRFWHLIYAVPDAQSAAQTVSLSQSRNAGFVYVTPGNLPNPWEILPGGAYWDAILGR